MKISIIIPVYKVSQFIERCLLSALNQTYPAIEYILVDDASPDNSMEIAEDLLKNHVRKEAVKIVRHSENRGLPATRNSGIQHATGDYLFFLDSDDAIALDCIQIMANYIEPEAVDFVIGEIEVFGNRRSAYPLLLLKEGFYHGNDLIFKAFLSKQWYEMAWNKLIKRELIIEKQLWFTEGIVHEDNLWSFQLALNAGSMAVTHWPTYHYHIQPQSITQHKSEKNIADYRFVIQTIIEYSHRNQLFSRFPESFPFLEKHRIYFIKSLIKSDLDKNFIQEQRQYINQLYKKEVWKKYQRKIEFLLKDLVLFLWFKTSFMNK
jgi:glycosyltransferase involved in cell wall biosynthesis